MENNISLKEFIANYKPEEFKSCELCCADNPAVKTKSNGRTAIFCRGCRQTTGYLRSREVAMVQWNARNTFHRRLTDEELDRFIDLMRSRI